MFASSISRLVPLVLRHLDAYGPIAGEDTRDAVSRLGNRIVRLLVAAGCTLLAAIMACAWLVIMAWDRPWREWVPAGLALLFVLLALGIGMPAVRRHERDPLFPRVRQEWQRDRELMEKAMGTLKGETGTHRSIT